MKWNRKGCTEAEAARAQAEADESAKGLCLYGQMILGSRESFKKTHFLALFGADFNRIGDAGAAGLAA